MCGLRKLRDKANSCILYGSVVVQSAKSEIKDNIQAIIQMYRTAQYAGVSLRGEKTEVFIIFSGERGQFVKNSAAIMQRIHFIPKSGKEKDMENEKIIFEQVVTDDEGMISEATDEIDVTPDEQKFPWLKAAGVVTVLTGIGIGVKVGAGYAGAALAGMKQYRKERKEAKERKKLGELQEVDGDIKEAKEILESNQEEKNEN